MHVLVAADADNGAPGIRIAPELVDDPWDLILHAQVIRIFPVAALDLEIEYPVEHFLPVLLERTGVTDEQLADERFGQRREDLHRQGGFLLIGVIVGAGKLHIVSMKH